MGQAREITNALTRWSSSIRGASAVGNREFRFDDPWSQEDQRPAKHEYMHARASKIGDGWSVTTEDGQEK